MTTEQKKSCDCEVPNFQLAMWGPNKKEVDHCVLRCINKGCGKLWTFSYTHLPESPR